MIDTGLWVPLASALSGILLGGLLAHLLSTRRDIAVKRRELILNNLILALEELERGSSSRPGTDLKQLEKMVSRVQLFGSRSLIEKADQVVLEMGTSGNADMTALAEDLRTEIRRQLKLDVVTRKYLGLVIRYPGDAGFEEEKAKRAKANVAGTGVSPA